ncbi:MAG: aspartate-semialdehyde dehydrogenase [Endozoicomonas sp.]
MNRNLDIAVYDAGSLAGEALLSLLDERNFPVATLYPLAESPDPDASVSFKGEELDVLNAAGFNFVDADLLFIPAHCPLSKAIVDNAIEAGCLVIDGSLNVSKASAILASVNPEQVADAVEGKHLIVPSSPAALMLPVLKPIQEAIGIDSVSVTACLSVSGSGNDGITELRGQTVDLLNGKPVKKSLYSQRVAYNLLPEVGEIEQSGFSTEELAIIDDVMAVLDDQNIRVSPTCVRAPVFFGDSLSVHLELDKPVDSDTARDLLTVVDGVQVLPAGEIPTVEALAGDNSLSGEVMVGRIRQNPVFPEQLSFWLVADTLKRGAINSIELAEILLKDFLK